MKEPTAEPPAPRAGAPGDGPGHPLAPHLELLRGTLRGVVDSTAHLMVITDARGHVLWSEGPPDIVRRAESIGRGNGSGRSEGPAGAVLPASGAHVSSTEHLARMLHSWSCVGSTITDPDSGEIIGCIDVSATIDKLHPATVALVGAAARLAEARLALDMHIRDDRLRARYQRHLATLRGRPGALVTPTGRVLAAVPDNWWPPRLTMPENGGTLRLPDGRGAVAEPLGDLYLVRALDLVTAAPHRPLLTLRLLGADKPEARLDGRSLPLSLRHAEILALLALNPRGLNADQCSCHLYGEEGNPTTLRAEIHRLRSQLGTLVLAKPYRLNCEVEADFLTVRRLLAAGDTINAARLHGGPLLPRSESPALRSVRDELTAQLRGRLLDLGDADALWNYAESEQGQSDLEVAARLLAVLPPGDARLVTARLRHKRLSAL
jgi:hypothetical protein